MAAILTLVLVLIVSMLVVRIAATALALTGLSSELARFQARSAFTGTGFTTSEAEDVVRHPVRRRIVMLLMILGNAGLVTVVASLMLTFVGTVGGDHWTQSLWFRLLVLVGAVIVLWWAATSRLLDRWLSRVIRRALKRWTALELRDYAGLLHLSSDHAVSELQVREGDWLTSDTLEGLRLRDEGVLVLGIERADGTYLGAPRKTARLHPGDVAIVYGRHEALRELDERRADAQGLQEHEEAVAEQREVERVEREVDQRGEGAGG